MSDWSHGYDVSTEYSFGFYREMAPDWLDFCAWIGGFEPPRRGGKPFRYLDLGCGQGFGLCLLAGANPSAEFVGVDFQPEHITHANGLAEAAGLSNVRFVQADFLDLASDWPTDFGTFDYAALHGILSWVSPALRGAVVRCLSHATAPGALVYASYNALPGCLSTVPLQHFSRRLKETAGHQGPGAVEQSIALLDRLAAANAPVFHALPALKVRLAALKGRDSNYLAHEYLTQSWVPFWHSDVAREFREAELDYVASATLADNLVGEFLPQALRETIAQHGELRHDLEDFVVNQAFHRDIFCRGARPRGGSGDSVSKDRTLVHLAASVPTDRSLKLETSFGEIGWEPAVFAEILEAVAQGPKTVGELLALPKRTEWMPRHVLLLLLHANILAPEATEPGEVRAAERLNAAIARAASEGRPYDHLAAARLGSAIRAAGVELLLLDSWLQSDRSADLSQLADGLAQRLAKLGRKLLRQGQPVAEDDAARELALATTAFLEETLPRWRRLGVVE
jgi:SAM-dependent methyltransferase